MSLVIDIHQFNDLAKAMDDQHLQGWVEDDHLVIKDEVGNRRIITLKELFYGSEDCVFCIRRIAKELNKLRFKSMRI